jgi:hypothetical protein
MSNTARGYDEAVSVLSSLIVTGRAGQKSDTPQQVLLLQDRGYCCLHWLGTGVARGGMAAACFFQDFRSIAIAFQGGAKNSAPGVRGWIHRIRYKELYGLEAPLTRSVEKPVLKAFLFFAGCRELQTPGRRSRVYESHTYCRNQGQGLDERHV